MGKDTRHARAKMKRILALLRAAYGDRARKCSRVNHGGTETRRPTRSRRLHGRAGLDD